MLTPEIAQQKFDTMALIAGSRFLAYAARNDDRRLHRIRFPETGERSFVAPDGRDIQFAECICFTSGAILKNIISFNQARKLFSKAPLVTRSDLIIVSLGPAQVWDMKKCKEIWSLLRKKDRDWSVGEFLEPEWASTPSKSRTSLLKDYPNSFQNG